MIGRGRERLTDYARQGASDCRNNGKAGIALSEDGADDKAESPSGNMCLIWLTFPDSEVKRGAGKKHIGKPVPTFIQCFQAKVSGQTLRQVSVIIVENLLLATMMVIS
jgi:hypothetical protein